MTPRRRFVPGWGVGLTRRASRLVGVFLLGVATASAVWVAYIRGGNDAAARAARANLEFFRTHACKPRGAPAPDEGKESWLRL